MKKYYTIEEAVVAAQALDPVLKTQQEYNSRIFFVKQYSTIEEAVVVAQVLDLVLKTQQEHSQTGKPKSRLSSDSCRCDDKEVLARMRKLRGEPRYSTIEEAMVAVQALYPVPKTMIEYHQTYKQNSRLPSNPDQYYSKEAWERIGKVRGFLGKDIPEEKYLTIEEAAKAVQALDPAPKTEQEYRQTYKQNSRLHFSPKQYYGIEAWARIGKWKGFLGTAKYPTIEEAAKAVQALDPVPKTGSEYHRIYKQNSRLPSHPYAYYGKEAWERIGGWKGFLGKK